MLARFSKLKALAITIFLPVWINLNCIVSNSNRTNLGPASRNSIATRNAVIQVMLSLLSAAVTILVVITFVIGTSIGPPSVRTISSCVISTHVFSFTVG